MLRLIKNKWFILSLITIFIFIIMGISANRDSKVNWLNNVISVPLTPVQKLFTSIGEKFSEGITFFKDIDGMRKENKSLKAKVEELEKSNRDLASLKDKNDQLRQALMLKDQFEDYTITGANIIAVDAGNWFNILKIDMGSNEGIVADSPVVTNEKGLVGRIMSTDITSSKVLTIIDEGSAVAVWIAKAKGGHAILRGDLTLKEKGLCKLSYIPLDVEVEVGDLIETSGLGGIFPKGITIGSVVKVVRANSDMDRYAVVQPSTDFKRLEEIYILKNKNNNTQIGSTGQ